MFMLLEIGNEVSVMANSNLVTREDLKNVFEALGASIENTLDTIYPVGSQFETTDLNFNPNNAWTGTWELTPKRDIVRGYGNKTVNSATTYTLCTITLEPNTAYLMLAQTNSSSGSVGTFICQIYTVGTLVTDYGYGYARTNVGSGGGVVAWRWVITGGSAVTVNLNCYGYMTASHTEYGNIIAIPTDRKQGVNTWKRIS